MTKENYFSLEQFQASNSQAGELEAGYISTVMLSAELHSDFFVACIGLLSPPLIHHDGLILRNKSDGTKKYDQMVSGGTDRLRAQWFHNSLPLDFFSDDPKTQEALAASLAHGWNCVLQRLESQNGEEVIIVEDEGTIIISIGRKEI